MSGFNLREAKKWTFKVSTTTFLLIKQIVSFCVQFHFALSCISPHLLLHSLLLLFWWLSSFRDAGAWTKPVISSKFSLQGDYYMCQHAFHSHIITCFGQFNANYSIPNAFLHPPFPPRLMVIFDMFWQLSMNSSRLVCLHEIALPGNHYLLSIWCLLLQCDVAWILIIALHVTCAPVKGESMAECKHWSEGSINA